MASIYDSIYGQSPYQLNVYGKPIRGGQKRWYDMTDMEKMGELRKQQGKLQGLQPLYAGEERRRDGRLREAFKPVLNVLQVIGGILNIPSSAISGAVKQLVDGSPGFDTQEYLRDIFQFKEQVSWRDVIGLLADKDDNQNMWDNKWSQIVFGLVLDIALDPLTYFGVGAIKGAKKGKELIKMLDDVGALAINKGMKTQVPDMAFKVNRTIANADRKITRAFGLKIPFSKKVAKPFRSQRLQDIISKAGAEDFVKPLGDVVTRKAIRATKGLAETRTGGQLLSDVMEKVVPGYKFLKKAVTPKKQALEGIIKAKMKMLNEVEGQSGDFLKKLGVWFGDVSPKQNEALLKYLDDPKYVDAKQVTKLHETHRLMSQVIVDITAGNKSIPTAINELYQANKKLNSSVVEGMIKQLRSNRTDVSPKWLLEQVGKEYDRYGIKKLQEFMSEAGLPFENLMSMAGWAPATKPFKEVFPKMWKEMTFEQRRVTPNIIDFARKQQDKWIEEAWQNNIAVKYRDAYVSSVKPGAQAIGITPEFGSTHPYWTKARVSKKTTHQLLAGMAKQVYESGGARSIEHAKKLLKAGKVEGLPRIVTTLQESLYMRGVSHYKAIHYNQFLKDARRFGREVPKGIAPTNMIVPNVTELSDLIFDVDTAKYLSNINDVLKNEESIGKFLKAIDNVHSWWKVLVYSSVPGAHFRNMYSNHVLGVTWQGMSYLNPKNHKLAWKIVIYNAFKKHKKVLAQMGKVVDIEKIDKSMDELIPGLKVTVKEAAAEAQKHGLAKPIFRKLDISRQRGPDVGGSLIKKIAKKLNVAGKESILAGFGDKAAGLIESQARVAAWIGDAKITDDLARSAWRTNEVFVNYQNITEFERQIGRRIAPFWSWLKQNIGNQVKFVFTQPGRYAKLPRIAQSIEAGAEKMPEHLKPGWFKENWMWQLPITLPDGTPLFFNPNFPFQDLNKLAPDQWKRTVLSSISPFAKVPIELTTGYDFFRQKQIEMYPGYKAPVPGILQDVVKVLPDSFKTALKIEEDKNGRYRMNPKAAHAIANLLPFVRNTSRMLMREDTRMEPDKYFQWASYMLGIKIKPVDKLTRQYYYTRDEIRKRQEQLR